MHGALCAGLKIVIVFFLFLIDVHPKDFEIQAGVNSNRINELDVTDTILVVNPFPFGEDFLTDVPLRQNLGEGNVSIVLILDEHQPLEIIVDFIHSPRDRPVDWNGVFV